AVGAPQDQLAARVVEDLAGHRVEVEADLVPLDLAERDRKKIEEQRPLGLRREGDHLALRVGVGPLEDVVQVGGLPAQAGAVVDDLAVDLARQMIDEAHRTCFAPGSSSRSTPATRAASAARTSGSVRLMCSPRSIRARTSGSAISPSASATSAAKQSASSR